MVSARKIVIITNNPLVRKCLSDRYEISFFGECSYRDILIKVRDLVYAGHALYTHPLAGSVKPNETPYRSVVLSAKPCGFSADQAAIIAEGVSAFDKFTPRNRVLTESLKEDFQVIDYTLLCGALDVDAAAGLSISNQ